MKAYIQPNTVTVNIQGDVLLFSASDDTEITKDNVSNFDYVKENRSSSHYSVWDDDWSN